MQVALNRCFLQLCFVACLCVASQVRAGTSGYTGRVVSVHDGDTVTVLAGEKKPVKIRLAQIDAPEIGQAFGQRSRDNLAEKVAGQIIMVEVNATDRYGRSVATLFLGQRNINREQIADGMAWVYRQYLNDPGLLEVESEAKAQKKGLWADPHPLPPWAFRHGSSPAGAKEHDPDTRSDASVSDPACGQKRFCREMVSCQEAQFYLRHCGLQRLDGDGNGIACEKLCANETPKP